MGNTPVSNAHWREEKKKKNASRTKEKYGCSVEHSFQLGNAMDEPLLFHSPGDQLAHLHEVLGCEILQAKKAEGCV